MEYENKISFKLYWGLIISMFTTIDGGYPFGLLPLIILEPLMVFLAFIAPFGNNFTTNKLLEYFGFLILLIVFIYAQYKLIKLARKRFLSLTEIRALLISILLINIVLLSTVKFNKVFSDMEYKSLRYFIRDDYGLTFTTRLPFLLFSIIAIFNLLNSMRNKKNTTANNTL